MACGCTQTARQEIVRLAITENTGNGYQLYTYPDCTTLHDGAYVGLTIFVVSRGTNEERLFKRNDLAAASDYSKTVFGRIEAIATADLCDQAVIDTYEGVPATA
jgi:hypothetical protein